MPIPLAITVYDRGVGGVPGNPLITDLAPVVTSYVHTISDKFGFESCAVSFPCSLIAALDWLQNGLMRSIIVVSPDAETVWEGYIETITATVGQKRASISLRNMANRVRTKYTLDNGTPGTTSAVSDAASQTLYGVRDRVVTIGQIPATAAATNTNERTLNQTALPRSSETTETKTGALGDVTLDIECAGWYSTLDWLFVPSSFDGTVNDTVQALIGDLLASAASTNAFVSTDEGQLAAMGYSLGNNVPSETTFRQQIDKYLSFGDNSNNPMTWGVYDDRILRSAAWAGLTPDTITYQEDASAGVIYDTYGANVIQPWNVRPNAMAVVQQFLDLGPSAGAVDAAARKYVARVTCTIQGDAIGCTLEPSGGSDLTTVLGGYTKRDIWN